MTLYTELDCDLHYEQNDNDDNRKKIKNKIMISYFLFGYRGYR
jgi:hypothetical protein